MRGGAPPAVRRVTSGRYVEVPHPWRAAIDVTSRHPARFYAGLIGQTLRCGLPARRRFGPALAMAARTGLPEGPVARALIVRRRRERSDLDALLSDVETAWPSLAERLPQLPRSAPRLAALALHRRAALTVFVFGERAQPLLVLKVPAAGDTRVDTELAALEEAEPVRVAPRSLGRIGEARVQEALAGSALRAEPLTPELAERLRWGPELAELWAALARLSAGTAKPGAPDQLDHWLRAAGESGLLSSRASGLLDAARRDIARLEVCVLEHRDTSPQNCLIEGGRLSGLVDWENGYSRGGPGLDVWNVALAWLEVGVGLLRWSEELVEEAFRRAWAASPFYGEARRAARAAATAAGVPDRFHDALELAFFGRRLGSRAKSPAAFPTGPGTAARMLESVCRS